MLPRQNGPYQAPYSGIKEAICKLCELTLSAVVESDTALEGWVENGAWYLVLDKKESVQYAYHGRDSTQWVTRFPVPELQTLIPPPKADSQPTAGVFTVFKISYGTYDGTCLEWEPDQESADDRVAKIINDEDLHSDPIVETVNIPVADASALCKWLNNNFCKEDD